MTQEHRSFFAVTVALLTAMLMMASCGDDGGETATTSTSTTTTSTTSTSTTTTAATATTSAEVTATSTAAAPDPEPPVINLAGWTTVLSQDGEILVEGWIDRPGRVTVGDVVAQTVDDAYSGLTTFTALLNLEVGEHAIEIIAVDGQGAENLIFLSVLVDPDLELAFGYLDTVDLINRTLAVDTAEFLTGEEANEAAVEDGVIAEGEEMPNDFYIRNQDPKLENLTLGDPGVIVLQACFPSPGPCVTRQAVGIDQWSELLDNPDTATELLGWHWYGSALLPYWFTIQDGFVVQIQEQYLP